MDIKEAREIRSHYLKTDEDMPGVLCGPDYANGFIEAWEARQEEIEFLKQQIEDLKNKSDVPF